MDTDKKSEDNKDKKEAAPADANAKATDTGSLSKPTDTESDKASDAGDKDSGDDKTAPTPKPNSFKQTLKRFRVYLLIVLLLAILGAIFATVTSLNGKKTPPPPSVQSQTLSQSQLKKLATSSSTSTSGQTLTIQGNAELDGQALLHSGLYVAGNLQSGGGLSVPELTISNSSSLGNAQASKLQVATTSTFQGVLTLQNGLNVKGNTSFSSASFGTLTATDISMSGTSQIQVPSHLAFTGAFPGRTISFGVLGNGGSASINGSDTSGTISLNTGNNPQIGCFLTVIFNQPFVHPPNILLGPIGLGAGAIQYSTELITSPDTGATTAFKICTANTPLPNQAFGFSYFINGAPY